jgi:hypothetical protein
MKEGQHAAGYGASTFAQLGDEVHPAPSAAVFTVVRETGPSMNGVSER